MSSCRATNANALWRDRRVNGRLVSIFERAGMVTIQDVAKRSYWDWMRMSGCGRRTVREIEFLLRSAGLSMPAYPTGGDYRPVDPRPATRGEP
jgi:hypothetical protein